jgi:hypothetical protein
MLFEKTSHNPLTDSKSNRFDKENISSFILFSDFEDSFHEEFLKGIQRILIHKLDEIKLNNKEIKHSTFSRYNSITFS